jgi:signal peptidase II
MKKTYIIVIAIVLALVAIDQGSKLLILNHNGGREVREICFDIQTEDDVTYAMYPDIDCRVNDIAVIPGIFHFTFSFNTGASFGSFSGNMVLFFVISAGAAVLFYFLLKDIDFVKKRFYSIAVVLMIGGGIGNFIDRLLYQKVTDFIEVEFVRFAIFNAADSFLVVGVILFGLDIILEEIHERNNRNIDQQQSTD